LVQNNNDDDNDVVDENNDESDDNDDNDDNNNNKPVTFETNVDQATAYSAEARRNAAKHRQRLAASLADVDDDDKVTFLCSQSNVIIIIIIVDYVLIFVCFMYLIRLFKRSGCVRCVVQRKRNCKRNDDATTTITTITMMIMMVMELLYWCRLVKAINPMTMMTTMTMTMMMMMMMMIRRQTLYHRKNHLRLHHRRRLFERQRNAKR
jgi:hypothetical protein